MDFTKAADDSVDLPLVFLDYERVYFQKLKVKER